jgi:guanylate kinase
MRDEVDLIGLSPWSFALVVRLGHSPWLFAEDRRGKSLSEEEAMSGSRGRLVILCGPSCVGKTPLTKALSKFHPKLYAGLHRLALYNSRRPRPGEMDGVDYHFRTREQVESLRADSRYAVIEARSDLQAVDVQELESLLAGSDVLFEGNPYVGRALQTHARLESVRRLSIFVSPLSREEIAYLKAPERNGSLQEFVADVMRQKLLRRTSRHQGILSGADLSEIEKRAGSAYRELQEAWHFDHVIVNHDGEDSDNWNAFYYLIGDARKALENFVALLKGEVAAGVEKWEEGLLG